MRSQLETSGTNDKHKLRRLQLWTKIKPEIWICVGFELNVKVVTLNTSLADPSKCQQNITSTGLSRGRLISSAQTWPVLTTCSFRFQGRPNERVWIYFLKYHFGSVAGARPLRRLSPSQPCHNHLEIRDIQPWVTNNLLIILLSRFVSEQKTNWKNV